MKSVGLVMIVKNESRCLEECLSRAEKLVDKIYITDTGSTDNTVEIAEKFHAHISHFTWQNDFAAARNYALAQSDCDWNLILDADEHLISGERKDLDALIERGGYIGAIQRHDSYREENGEISKSRIYTTRFVPRGTQYAGRIHEQIVSDLPIAPLPLAFDHDGYLYENKGNRNLEILMMQLKDQPEDSYALYQIAHTMRLLKDHKGAAPYFEAFYRLVPDSGTGYRTRGVISYLYNLLELKEFEKGLQIISNEKDRLSGHADYHFFCGNFFIKLILSDIKRYINYLPEIEHSFLRCLEIGESPGNEGVLGCGSFKASYNLGLWFELNGNIPRARSYYQQAAKDGYAPAVERLKTL